MGGQNNSPGAAGGNRISTILNNTFVVGQGDATSVNQFNQNSIGGSGNTVDLRRRPRTRCWRRSRLRVKPDSPGAAGGDRIGINFANNTYIAGSNNTTQIVQRTRTTSAATPMR